MVSVAVFVGASVAAAVVLGSGRKKGSVKPFLVSLQKPMTEPATRTWDHGEDKVNFGKSACQAAKNQPMPDLAALGLTPVLSAAGPIGAVIVAGVGIVKGIFQELGAKQVCTVRGGRFEQFAKVQAPSAKFWGQLQVGYGSKPPAAFWIFGGAAGEGQSADGEVTVTSEQVEGSDVDYPSGEAAYLLNGGKPPGQLWPHVNLADFEPWLPADMERPRVLVTRSGNQLTFGVWLPPRAPLSHLSNVTSERVVDAPVRWRLQWMVTL